MKSAESSPQTTYKAPFSVEACASQAQGQLSRPTQRGRGRWEFQFSVRYPGVVTMTQEATLQTKLYLEFSGVTEDGSFATS